MKKNMLKNRKKKGFTLIELIAVIAILGILIAVIAPRMTGYTDSAKVSKTKANVKTLVTAIEVYNSTAKDVPVDVDTTVADMIDGEADADTDLDGDTNAIDTLKETAKSISEGDDAIETTTTYENLLDALDEDVTTYGGIKAVL
ncbi:prepilin-type N-terminal cleavage/methylation domain-containing protein [Anoxybacterium hadale]|uniref:Prepilin-type N-terminal cleavage/methylation domain-containing protein n=1 Tax=Anoxybacterium hadale TaxID=3408580 RepID=A0ACD1A9D9_9FIRM|nr:prepilin-type N-terminal cleavage/methylation domain-containing protein [Clostridiales bacterium]